MPWKKGESGNPNGRPPAENSLNNLLREKLEETDPDKKRSNKDIIADALVALAKQGNLAAIERVWDRVEGKPTQALEHTVFQEENPLVDVLRKIVDGPESKTD